MIDQVGKDSIMRASPHLDESKKELCMLATRTLGVRACNFRCPPARASRKFGLVAKQ